MHGAGREAALGQLVGDVGGGPLGPAEDHRQAAAVGLQDARDQLDLVQRVGAEDVLGGVGHGVAGVVRRGGPDVGRLAHVPAGEADDLARHGGREQQRLPLGRQHGQDLLDVGQEAQVEHLVRLVQDERADPRQVELLLPGEVQQAAGGADDDVDALPQRLDLRLVRPAAVDGEHTDVTDLAGGLQVVGDLGAQLAGRDDDQRLRALAELLLGRPAGVDVGAHDDALDQRQAEAQGLAGAGLGLADDIVAGQSDRQGHLLDREGVDDADGLQGLGRLREDSELPERGLRGFSGGGQGAASSMWGAESERAAGSRAAAGGPDRPGSQLRRTHNRAGPCCRPRSDGPVGARRPAAWGRISHEGSGAGPSPWARSAAALARPLMRCQGLRSKPRSEPIGSPTGHPRT